MALLTSKTWVWVSVIIISSLVLYRLNSNQTQAAFDGRQAHDYLCFQKQVGIPKQIAELNKHIDRSLKYETDVQLGYRKAIPGITTADIEQGIADDQDHIDALNFTKNVALSKVKCKQEAPHGSSHSSP